MFVTCVQFNALTLNELKNIIATSTIGDVGHKTHGCCDALAIACELFIDQSQTVVQPD